MKVDAGRLRDYLGTTEVSYIEGETSLGIVDSTLG
jgi:hypothetical protein